MPKPVKTAMGGARVLLIGDEPDVLGIVSRMIEELEAFLEEAMTTNP